jgi:outer membrane protein assembly factor BamB
MPKTPRLKPVLLVGLFLLCTVPACLFQKVSRRKPILSELVSPELLGQGKLEVLWHSKLPIKQGESLRDLYILGDYIHCLSDRNYMVSLNRDNGNVVFSQSVAPVGFRAFGLQLYKNEILSVIGDRFVQINPETGTVFYGMYLDFGVVCPLALNSSYYYLGGADSRVHVLRLKDKVQVFDVAAENNSMIVSIVADERFVVFATEAGNVISIAPDRPKRLWSFNVAGGIVGPVVKDGDSLFFACKDTNVYKLNALTGELVWKYAAGAVLDVAPQITRDVLYQYVHYKGLAAIDKNSGAFLWQLPEGVDLLAQSGSKAYVITNVGTMVVMDNNKAKQLYSVNFAPVSKYATNVVDSKIYIADDSGRIACLKPIE